MYKVHPFNPLRVVDANDKLVYFAPTEVEASIVCRILNEQTAPPPPERITTVEDVVRRALLEVLAPNHSEREPVEYIEATNALDLLDNYGGEAYNFSLSRDFVWEY